MAPDLRESMVPLNAAAFRAVVRDGQRTARAMPGYPNLDDQQLLALRHYIRRQAHATAPGD